MVDTAMLSDLGTAGIGLVLAVFVKAHRHLVYEVIPQRLGKIEERADQREAEAVKRHAEHMEIQRQVLAAIRELTEAVRQHIQRSGQQSQPPAPGRRRKR